MLSPVTEGVYVWQALNVALKRHMNGYLFMTRIGPIMVDPPSMAEVIVEQVEALGKPKAIIVTGRHHERRTAQYKRWYKAKVFAPQADRKLLKVHADHYYMDGESLPGGFVSVQLGHQRTPGETVLYHAKSKLLVANHLVGAPEGYIQMQGEGVYWNFSRAFEAQLKLLDLDFDVILPGRGHPIATDGKMVLARFLAGYGVV